MDRLRGEVSRRASTPEFVHADWFVTYHLQIVERLAQRFTSGREGTDATLVDALVWLHDFGKISSLNELDRENLDEVESVLRQSGFPSAFSNTVMGCLTEVNSPRRLDKRARIESRIVSSADACSHLIGPFFMIYWRENQEAAIERNLVENERKLVHDWSVRVSLPEAADWFATQRQAVMHLVDWESFMESVEGAGFPRSQNVERANPESIGDS
jgi:hypothetical protein